MKLLFKIYLIILNYKNNDFDVNTIKPNTIITEDQLQSLKKKLVDFEIGERLTTYWKKKCYPIRH